MQSYQVLGDNIVMRIPFIIIVKFTASVALISFAVCVLWSLKYNFAAATSTHCGVPNYLPSISAAIGGFTPQRYIWRIGIALHAAPRLLVPLMYHNYYIKRLGKLDFGWITLIRLNSFLHALEIFSLIGLTYVSSKENYGVHEKCFVSFMITSELYMLLSCYLSKKSMSHSPNQLELQSMKMKKLLTAANIGSFGMAILFFFRHNWYCEPGVYTLFALFEYLVVLTNIAFHSTVSYDFPEKDLIVGTVTDKSS